MGEGKKRSSVFVIKPAVEKKQKRNWSMLVIAGLGFIATIGGVVGFGDLIWQKSKSNHQEFLEKNYITGILIPGSLNPDSLITFWLGNGGFAMSIRELRKGAVYPATGLVNFPNGLPPWNLQFKIIGNRLFISAEIRYFENNAMIGRILFNEWQLRSSDITDFEDSDTRLVVRDKENNIALALEMVDPNNVRLLGYAVDQDMTYIMQDIGIGFHFSTNKDAIRRQVRKIQLKEN